ncbi:glycosyltransferase [Paraburkholderia phytofirmans]|uniref:glycosyltransferase n=1 Tax=Paraburkholderia phytofirmans TaxID=261302 RepID=UPI0038BC4FA1
MKKRYDVLFHVPSLKGGGAERVAIEVARFFLQQGRSVGFFVHSDEVAYDLPSGAELIVARGQGHFQRIAEFRSLLKRVDVHAVISFLPYANLISLLANVGRKRCSRLIVSEHQSYAQFKPNGIKERIKFSLLKRLYASSDLIVAVSNGVAEDLRQRLSKAGASKIVVIHNPCYIPDALPLIRRDASSSSTILAVGRLAHEKGIDVLIDAFATVSRKLADARLVIVGEGPKRKELEEQIARLRLKDKVNLPGFKRSIADEYRRADLFVLASRAEGFGNVLVEAMSFGLKIVSTDRPGPAEILDNGKYGTLVPVEDVAVLADAMVNALTAEIDPYQQIRRAQDFALDLIGAQYAKATGIAG